MQKRKQKLVQIWKQNDWHIFGSKTWCKWDAKVVAKMDAILDANLDANMVILRMQI